MKPSEQSRGIPSKQDAIRALEGEAMSGGDEKMGDDGYMRSASNRPRNAILTSAEGGNQMDDGSARYVATNTTICSLCGAIKRGIWDKEKREFTYVHVCPMSDPRGPVDLKP